jgi:LuxR family maltose regulon positive regulatory protein
MSARTPTVSACWVYAEERPGWSVRLDTAAWVAWLEEPTTTRFAYPLVDPAKGYIVGRMTVRKERRTRGGVYWTAYRRTGGDLRKVYLGRSQTLTYARLEAIARLLRAPTTEQPHETPRTGGGLLFD